MFEGNEEHHDGHEMASDHPGDSTDEVTPDSDDYRVGRWGRLFLLVPLVGFFMYLVWRKDKPEKAKTAVCFALCGLALGMVVGIVKGLTDSQLYTRPTDYSRSYAFRERPRVNRVRPVRRTYDLRTDWSSEENPNGVWSYNHDTVPITQSLSWRGHTGWGYRGSADGCIIQVGDPNAFGQRHDMQPGDIVMHALSVPFEGDSKSVNVTWTSPLSGTIDIRGRAWDAAIAQDRDMTWSLKVDGSTVAERSSLRGLSREDPDARFSANHVGHGDLDGMRVRRGTRVEFRLSTATHYGHFAGVELQIILNTIALRSITDY